MASETTARARLFESETDNAAYRRDGFVLKHNALPQHDLAELRQYVDEFERLDPVPHMLDVYYEQPSINGGEIVRQIENICSFHPQLRRFADGWLRDWAGILLGDDAVLFKDKVNYKHSGGGGYPAHRDGRFWWRCPRTGEPRRGWEHYASGFVSAAVFIDAADAANGCIEIARGMHTKAAVGAGYRELDDADASAMRFEPVPTAAGDVLFFDALTPHRSGPNNSPGSRRVLYLTYNRLSEGDHSRAYFRDKRISLSAQEGPLTNK